MRIIHFLSSAGYMSLIFNYKTILQVLPSAPIKLINKLTDSSRSHDVKWGMTKTCKLLPLKTVISQIQCVLPNKNINNSFILIYKSRSSIIEI